MDYQIAYTPPPVYERARAKFGIDFKRDRLVMVYGDTIHQSFQEPMTPDLLNHELVHVRQQAAYPGGADAWWERYLADRDFRVSQELEAYQTQHQWASKHYGRRERRNLLDHCARDLSGHIYGKAMTFAQARDRIQDTDLLT